MSRQAVIHCAIIGHGSGGLIDYYDIETCQLRLVVPERFSSDSFNAVSCYRFAAMFFRNGQTKPAKIGFVVAAKHCKEFIPAACSFFEHAAESGRIQ